MDSEVALTRQARAWLSDSVLGVRSDSYARYLTERGYSLSSVRNYLSCIANFAHWLKKRRTTLRQIDEALVQRFLDDHLPRT
jgi:site-specific recombinase XerD